MDMDFQRVCEGFAVETVEGLIFTVKGCLHPDDRFIAYLRYLPDPTGGRKRDGKTYRRIYRFADQQAILEKDFPEYLGNDPCFGLPVQWVQTKRIRRVYDPVCQLAEICSCGGRNRAEQVAAAFADWLTSAAGIGLADIGISGSVLYGLQRPDSDLDFIVYGDRPSRAVHAALGHRLDDRTADAARRLEGDELRRLHEAHCPDTPLSFENFAMHQNRKVNEGMFHGHPYFIRFVKRPAPGGQRYGDPCYRRGARATLTARVVDDSQAIFTPCTYKVKDASLTSGQRLEDLREIASFRGRFADQARSGEQVQGRGSLERVEPRNGPAYRRLVVGGTVGDYLKTQSL